MAAVISSREYVLVCAGSVLIISLINSKACYIISLILKEVIVCG